LAFSDQIDLGNDYEVESNIENTGYRSPYTGVLYNWESIGDKVTMSYFEWYMMNRNHPRYLADSWLTVIPNQEEEEDPLDEELTIMVDIPIEFDGNERFDAILLKKDIDHYFDSMGYGEAEVYVNSLNGTDNYYVLLEVVNFRLQDTVIPDMYKYNVVSNW
jgi:hypothetical protein